jgi:SAM-dependent methyltransferase
MAEQQCRICAAPGPHPSYTGREMMFGSGDSFDYFQCTSCGCLQIGVVPGDLASYYPDDYYSFRTSGEPRSLSALTRPLRVRRAFSGKGLLGALLSVKYPYSFAGVRSWLSRTGTGSLSRILDVGCGSGELLQDLASQGYRNLLGIDPFLDGNRALPGGVELRRTTIHELSGTFDLIMFHHVLEHVADPKQTLAAAARLLAPGGHILVRVPLADSFAWEHYRENWVQMDPPRHLFLHTVRSMELTGGEAGLELRAVEHDSTAFQFIGSELYRRGASLTSGRRLPRWQVWSYRNRARELNRQGRGDQAAFFFAPSAG